MGIRRGFCFPLAAALVASFFVGVPGAQAAQLPPAELAPISQALAAATASAPAYDISRVDPNNGDGYGVVPPIAIDSSGRYVAYVEGSVTDGTYQVYRRDALTGNVDLVSHSAASATVEGNGYSWSPVVISADGRYVAYYSDATNLVASMPSTVNLPLYVTDMQTGVTTLVPPPISGQIPNYGNGLAISGDGTRIAFAIQAPTPSGSTQWVDYVENWQTGTTVAAIVTANNPQGPQSCYDQIELSGDGHTLVCEGQVGPDTPDAVAVYDVATATSLFQDYPVATTPPSVSSDGRFVAYTLQNSSGQSVQIWDRTKTGFSPQTITSPDAGVINWPSLSADGSQLAFETNSNTSSLVYSQARVGGTPVLVSTAPDGTAAPNGDLSDLCVVMAGSGTAVAFTSNSTALDPTAVAPPQYGSAAFLARLRDSAAPTWPSGAALTASNVGQQSLSLSWPAATDDVAVAGYRLSEDGNQIADLPAATTSYDVSGLQAGTRYSFAVTAYDLGKNNSTALSADVTTQQGGAITPGDDPLRVTSTYGGVATLKWDPAPSAAGYQILRDDGSGTFAAIADVEAAATSYDDSGLLSSTTYEYRVDLLDSTGAAGPWTAVAQTTTPALFLDSVDAIATTTCCNLADLGSNLAITVTGEANRQASATVSYQTLLQADGSFATTPRDATAQVSLAAQAGGSYVGAFTLAEGTVAVTAVTGVLSDGDTAHDVRKDASQLPVDVGGAIAVTVEQPATGDVTGSTLTVSSATYAITTHRSIDAPGTYTFPVPAGTDWVVSLAVPGQQQPVSANASVNDGRTKTVDLMPNPAAELKARVTAGDGGLPGGVNITVTAADGTLLAKTSIPDGGTNSVPMYGLPIGATVTINTTLIDTYAAYYQHETTTVTLQQGENTVDIVKRPLPRAALAGTITQSDGTTPISGAGVSVSENFDGRTWRYSTTTAADGSYSLDVVAGNLSVTTSAAGYLAKTGNVDATAAGPVRYDTSLLLSAASLSVHVVPPAGQTAGGVTVVVSDPIDGIHSVDVASGQTDANFTALTTGQDVTVRVKLDDLTRPLQQQVTTTATLGENANDVTVDEVALPTANVSGVVTKAGVAFAGQTVQATEQVDGRSWTFTATSADDGSYHLQVLAGTVSVTTPNPPGGYGVAKAALVLAPAQDVTANLDMPYTGAHLVHLRLYTQDYGGQETLQTLDWTTNIHFRTSLRDAGGSTVGIYGNDFAIADKSSSLTFCADGAQAALPSGCVTQQVDPDHYEVTLELHLAQAAGVTANLVAPDGTPSSGHWYVYLTPLDANGYAMGESLLTAGDGAAVRFGVPVAGRYRAQLSASSGNYFTTLDLPDQTLTDLGTIQLANRSPFSSATTTVEAVPASVLPGQLFEIRTQFSAATTLNNAVMRLEVPAGSTLVPDGVTYNGAPISGTLVDGFYEVPLGTLSNGMTGVLRYSLQADADAPVGTMSARVRVRYNGTLDDPVGTGNVQVIGVVLDAPSHVTASTFTVRGQAPAGVQVTVNDVATGAALTTTTAGPGGLWSASVPLVAPAPGSRYRLTASAGYAAQQLTSAVSDVVFDPNWLLPTSMTVSQPTGRAHTFDPSAGTAYFTLVYVPSQPIRVSATFTDTSRLINPTAWVGRNSAAMTCTATSCTADVSVTPSTIGDVWLDYDVDPVPASTVQNLPTAPNLQQAAAGASAPFTGIAPTVTTNADGSVDVRGNVVASDGTPVDVDSTVSASPTTSPAGEAVQVADGVTIYVTHSLSVDGDGNATFTEDFTVPSSLASQFGSAAFVGRGALRLEPAESVSDWIVFHVATAATGTKGAIGALISLWNHIRVAPDKYYDALTSLLADIDNAKCLTPAQKALLRAEVDTAGVQVTLIYTMQGFTPVPLVAAAPEIDGALGVSGISAGLIRSILSGAFSWTYGKWMQHVVDDTAADVEKVLKDSGCPQLPPPPPGPPAAHPTIIFDPSGFTYEALASNRLAGVTATIETAPSADGPWTTWDAGDFGQDNPQVTDDQGRYGWDVPVGWYRVRFDKDGFTTTYSQVVHVLPEWTDLNVGLGRIAPAAVTGLAMAADGSEIDLSFDTWMKVRSVEQQVSVRGHGRDRVKGQLVALDPQQAPDGTMLATRFAFRPDHGFHGPDVTLVVGGDALDYAGVPLGSSASQTFSLAPGGNDDQHDRGLAAGWIEDDRLRV